MAPIPMLLAMRDFLSDAGDKLKETGETVADGGKNAADQAKGAGETIGKAQDLLDTFEKLKAQATGYYQIYLDNKPLIYFGLACIALVLLLCAAQCCVQYTIWIAKCCCLTVNCGMWCVNHAHWCCCFASLFRWCGACCVATGKCRPDQKAINKSAEKRNEDDTGCDTTFITRCGAPAPSTLSFEDAQMQRLGPWINHHAPCTLVPGNWGTALNEEQRDEKLKNGLEYVKKGIEKLTGKPIEKIPNWEAAAAGMGRGKGAAIVYLGERYDKLERMMEKIEKAREKEKGTRRSSRSSDRTHVNT